MNSGSELRQDLVSGDWIVIAPKRAHRPDHIVGEKKPRKRKPKSTCPFENPQKHGNGEPFLVYPTKRKWQVQAFENKYPAFMHSSVCGTIGHKGPYSVAPGFGHHDVIVSRSHDKNFPKLDTEDANLIFQAFRDRYLQLTADPCLAYVSMFHNWGPTAGATVYHPHYQMVSVPITPPDITHSLTGSHDYYQKHHQCVHCDMIAFEQKEGGRIIFENAEMIAFTPFVSKTPFELRIFPKQHTPFFENTQDHVMSGVVEAVQKCLSMLEKHVADPDYNFFIHTAPMKDKQQYEHYHWHIEVLPKVNIRAGFELGTGMEINSVDPDEAAAVIRGERL